MSSLPSSWFARFVVASLLGAFGIGDAAGDEGGDKARAQALFMEGRAAIEKGDKQGGCAKMRESLGIFAVANTLFNVAQCDEGEGKIASALEHWERGLALIDAKDQRSPVAKERIAELSPRVPRLRIVIPTGQDVSAVVVDDMQMSPSALSAPLYMEPGKHVIVVKSPGRQDRQHQVVLAERERTEFVATPSEATDGSRGTTHPPASNARRTAGFVVAGVGALGLIAAGGTGVGVVSTSGDIDSIDAACTRGENCDLEGRKPLVSRYRTLVWANTAAWGVGIAGVGVGLVMILTSPAKREDTPPKAAVAPVFLPGGAGLNVSGRF